jgi:hypothetical protein
MLTAAAAAVAALAALDTARDLQNVACRHRHRCFRPALRLGILLQSFSLWPRSQIFHALSGIAMTEKEDGAEQVKEEERKRGWEE